MKKDANKKQIDWHAGFAGGLELSLREYEGLIEIDREYELTKKAPKIDFIVIKKDADIIIDIIIRQGSQLSQE